MNVWPYDMHNCFRPVAERGEASKQNLCRSGSLRLKPFVDPNRTNKKETIVRLELSLET